MIAVEVVEVDMVEVDMVAVAAGGTTVAAAVATEEDVMIAVGAGMVGDVTATVTSVAVTNPHRNHIPHLARLQAMTDESAWGFTRCFIDGRSRMGFGPIAIRA